MKFSCCFIYTFKKSKWKAKLKITHWLIKVTVYIRIVLQQHGRTREVSCAIPPQRSRLCAGPVPPKPSQFSLADRRHPGPSSCRLSLAWCPRSCSPQDSGSFLLSQKFYNLFIFITEGRHFKCLFCCSSLEAIVARESMTISARFYQCIQMHIIYW